MAPRCRYGECTGIFWVLLCSIFKRHKKLSIYPQSWKDCLAQSFQSWISRSNCTPHIKIMLIPNISQQPCTSTHDPSSPSPKVLLFSTVLYVVDDPDNVDSLSTAIYMSTVTVTTVGYGTELSGGIFDGQVAFGNLAMEKHVIL